MSILDKIYNFSKEDAAKMVSQGYLIEGKKVQLIEKTVHGRVCYEVRVYE